MPLGNAVRAMAEAGDFHEDSFLAALAFATARLALVKKWIKPALMAGKWVLCDRYVDSSYAYQGAAGQSEAFLKCLNTRAEALCMPDITFLLEIDQASHRSRGGGDNAFERDSFALFSGICARFRQRAAAFPERFRCIDGKASQELVHNRIVSLLEKEHFFNKNA